MNLPEVPKGSVAWRRAYGAPEPYIEVVEGVRRLNEQWRRDRFTTIELPFGLRLAWDRRTFVNRITVHKYAAPAFDSAFTELERLRLAVFVQEFGGTYADRSVRGGSRLSTHAWAASIDLNPETNPLGGKGDMRDEVVEVFESRGFTWGGRWARPDPMHFQYGEEWA